MAKSSQLPKGEREFFELVARAAFANPFSDERVQLDKKMVGVRGKISAEDLLQRVSEEVAGRVQKLEEKGQADFRQYPADEQYAMQTAFLFDVFHRYLAAFDQLILEQIKAGDEPCPVPFARDALAMMKARGFAAEEATRFFAMFYQLRRAFYFVDRSLIGRSPCMKQLRRLLWDNVFTHDIRWYERFLWNRMEDFSTMLLGETGTGKGTAGAAIGRSGFIPFDTRRNCFVESFTKAFVSLNLSQFPESLIESELFGHRKGAFTGAIEHHDGIFSRCSPHGAIFLDEIGEVSIPVQIKLLQVLQDRTFSPVGSHERKRFEGRVIGATNKPLDELRRSGKLRDDFHYRLSSDWIVMPPLRQRIQEDPRELEDLLAHILQRLCGDNASELIDPVLGAIKKGVGLDYAWPGNVRELEQAARCVLLRGGYEGDVKGIAPDLQSSLLAGVEAGTLDAGELLSQYCQLLYKRHGTYEDVAKTTGLDWRTVKKHVEAAD